MILPDVNVLVAAYRDDAPGHAPLRDWLITEISSGSPFGLADVVLSGFLRVVTHPRIFKEPTPLADALDFLGALRSRPNRVTVSTGPRHWGLFVGLCELAGAKGNLVPDAFLAALAIESGAEWITTDRDYARFPGLRWRNPLGG